MAAMVAACGTDGAELGQLDTLLGPYTVKVYSGSLQVSLH